MNTGTIRTGTLRTGTLGSNVIESTAERSRRAVILPYESEQRESEALAECSSPQATMRTCIVPVDFSAPSLMALQWAGFLAGVRGMRLLVVHAIPSSHFLRATESYESRFDNVCQRLSNLCQPLTRLDHSIEVVCTIEDPVEAIVRESRRALQPMIVMGNRGLSRIRRVFLGSVAEGVERRASCPVLVVHEDDEPPLRISSDVEKVLRVVVGVDFQADCEAALASFRSFASCLREAGYSMDVTLFSALPQAQWVDIADVPVVKTPDFGALERDTTDRLRPIAKSLRIEGMMPQIVIEHGDPATRILQYARDSRANLIVVGRHAYRPITRMLLGSTAERVLHGSRVPVLTARAAQTSGTSNRTARESCGCDVRPSRVRARIVT